MARYRGSSFADAVPEAVLASRLEGGPDFAPLSELPYTLPVVGRLEDLGVGPPSLTSPLMPRYASLVDWALERLGQPADAFHAWRLVLSYPPLPSSPHLSVPLPPRPQA